MNRITLALRLALDIQDNALFLFVHDWARQLAERLEGGRP